MTKAIEIEIQKFEQLQKKYAVHGAQDSDSRVIFYMVIAQAMTRDTVDVGAQIDWDLYAYEDEDGDLDADGLATQIQERDQATLEMTEQAWRVYDCIQQHGTPEDALQLRKYCTLLDDAEFIPFT